MADKDFDYGLPTPCLLGIDPELILRPIFFGVLHTDRTITVERYRGWIHYKDIGDKDTTIWTTRLFEEGNAERAYTKAHGMIFERCIR